MAYSQLMSETKDLFLSILLLCIIPEIHVPRGQTHLLERILVKWMKPIYSSFYDNYLNPSNT